MHRAYYDTLGVPQGADAAAIKKAFRKLAHQYHPDRNKNDPESERKFKEVNRAYEVLSDPEKRKLYDEFGAEAENLGFDANRARAASQWGARAGGSPYGGGVDVDDFFGQVFGGGQGFGGAGGAGPRRGRDVEASLTLDFVTSVQGGERTINIDGRDVTVRIPPGVRHGGTLRLRGQGLDGVRGGPSGDLLLTIRVAPDPDFERDGDDLRVVVPITIGEALRGAQVEVPTLDGSVRVKVPPGAQSGQVLRVRARGVASKGRPRGDLLVELRVRMPDLAGRDAEEAISTLEALYAGDVREALSRRKPS